MNESVALGIFLLTNHNYLPLRTTDLDSGEQKIYLIPLKYQKQTINSAGGQTRRWIG